MFKYNFFKRRRFPAWLSYACIALLMILPSGCGNNDSSTSEASRTGSASFAIQWHTSTDDRQATGILTEQAIEDCGTVGIEFITCEVYDAANNLVARGGPWPCSAHEGTIESIPSGSNFTFAVLGWDNEQTNIIYHGQTTNVTISPGELEDVGTIDAYGFVPTGLSATAVSSSQIDLDWSVSSDISSTITNYNIYRDGVLYDTATSTVYSDTGDLSPETQYCYTVSANDVYGNTSGLSNQDCATPNDNQAPSVTITSPEDGAAYDHGASVDFSGTAMDPEDDALTGESLVWTSNIDGGIGTGNTFTRIDLAAGVHTITLTATDQDGAPASASITLTIIDRELPTVPGNLVATAVSRSQINLSWTASEDNVGVVQYQIYRDSELAGTTVSTTYSDTGLVFGATHCYTVIALDAAGNPSGQSNEDCTTTIDNLLPIVTITSPEDTAAYDQGVSVDFSGTAVDPEDDALTGESLVWTSNIDGGIGTGNAFSLATLSAGVHTITLTATDQDGAPASVSITLTIIDRELPTVPGNLVATAVSRSQIDLSWTASEDNVGVIEYQIYRDGELAGTTASTIHSDTGLGFGTTYCYTVIALDAAGNPSGPSNEDCATTIDNRLPIVTITSPEGGATYDQSVSVNFSGTAVDPEDDALTGDSLVWTSDIDDGIGTGNDFSIATLSAGVHTITLTATDEDGATASNSITLTIIDTELPTVPANLVATAVTRSQINLNWTASTDNVGVVEYQIYLDGELSDITTSTNLIYTGVVPGTEYCYTVTALDAAGNPSGQSNEACATTSYGPNILFLNFFIDITDQNFNGYYRLASYLRQLDYNVSQTNLTTITSADLLDYHIVVFGGDYNRDILLTEADAIRGFAQNGGGVLLLGDHGIEQWSITLRSDLHLVTELAGEGTWGIEFEANMLCDGDDFCRNCATADDPDGGVDYPLIRPTGSHMATYEVTSFVYNWGASLIVDENIARVIATSSMYSWRDLDADYIGDGVHEYHCEWDQGSEYQGVYPAMAVAYPGDGQVVAIGDNGMWFNIFFDFNVEGTQSLARSVFNFLSYDDSGDH